MPALALIAGFGLIFVVLQDAFEVMLLPRRVQRRLRFVRLYYRQSWTLVASLVSRLPPGAQRERILSIYGPLSMVLLFATWAAGLISAGGLIEWALHVGHGDKALTLPDAFYLSGVTFFTIGYGDVAPHTSFARMLAVAEGGTGLGFIAVVISYLPVLYQLFAQREAHVILLDGRAGTPPTAGGMILRHVGGSDLTQLDAVLLDWEKWSAELLESQLSYPMLAFYRSQHDNHSWLAALACIMDTCALVLVGSTSSPLQARMTFTMSRQVLVQMAEAFSLAPADYSGGDRLDGAGYDAVERAIVGAGINWEAGSKTRETLAALRATYEPLLTGLASFLLVPLPGFLPHSDKDDYWSGGHRGALARTLIEELSSR